MPHDTRYASERRADTCFRSQSQEKPHDFAFPSIGGVRRGCVHSGGRPAAGLAAEHTKDSLETVKERLKDKSAVLLDVREQKEWDEGHLQDGNSFPSASSRSRPKRKR